METISPHLIFIGFMFGWAVASLRRKQDISPILVAVMMGLAVVSASLERYFHG